MNQDELLLNELQEANEKMNKTARVFGIFKREVYFRAKEDIYLCGWHRRFNEQRIKFWINTKKSPKHLYTSWYLNGIMAQLSIQKPNDEYKTQEQWIAHYNANNQIFMSAKDMMQVTDKEQVASLQKDFYDSYIMTSTRIEYGEKLTATITHRFGSKYAESKKVKIPIYSWERIEKVLSTKDGLIFMETLLGKKGKKAITIELERISGKKVIEIYTPDQESRNNRPSRSVGFYSGGGWFYVDAGDWFVNGGGRSRRVLSKSEPKARSNDIPMIAPITIKGQRKFVEIPKNRRKEVKRGELMELRKRGN